MTVEGAKQLVDMVDACSMFADAQLANLADAKKIKWDLSRHGYDHDYITSTFEKNGVHLSGYFEYGGLFVQAKFDEDMSHLIEGTLGHHKHGGKQLYYLHNNTWRPITSMDDLSALGLDVSTVSSLTDWQFKQFRIGGALPRAEIDEIMKNKTANAAAAAATTVKVNN